LVKIDAHNFELSW